LGAVASLSGLAERPADATAAIERAWSAADVHVSTAQPSSGSASRTALGIADPGIGAARAGAAYGSQDTVAGLGRVQAPAAHTSGRRLAMPLPSTHASIAV